MRKGENAEKGSKSAMTTRRRAEAPGDANLVTTVNHEAIIAALRSSTEALTLDELDELRTMKPRPLLILTGGGSAEYLLRLLKELQGAGFITAIRNPQLADVYYSTNEKTAAFEVLEPPAQRQAVEAQGTVKPLDASELPRALQAPAALQEEVKDDEKKEDALAEAPMFKMKPA